MTGKALTSKNWKVTAKFTNGDIDISLFYELDYAIDTVIMLQEYSGVNNITIERI
jgi:hypothetical protein